MTATVIDIHRQKLPRIHELGNFDHSHTAVEDYFRASNAHERKDFTEHAERVAEIVEIYAGDIVSPAVIDAALLHDVAERVMDTDRPPEVRQAAARMIAERLTSPDLADESLAYLASVIGDLGFIETAAEYYRSVIAETEDVDEETKEALTTSRQNDIAPELYRIDEPILDFAHLKCISEQVNIESIIIKAAEIIDNLMHPSPYRPASALQDIIEAETFYAPLLEQLKLDAMASKLRTESKKLRHKRAGGKPEYEAIATSTFEAIQRNGSEKIMAALFGEHEHDVEFKTVALSDGEPSLFGSGSLRNEAFDFRDIHYRAKSIGSYIDKLERFKGEEPLDAFGIIVVVGEDEDIAKTYVDTVAKLLDNPAIELVAAPSKKKPGYVQGNLEYVQQVTSLAEGSAISEYLQIEPKDDAPDLYSVCKVTLKVTLPCGDIISVEIQMLTDKDREGARVGLQAHSLFKQYEHRSEQKVDPLVLVKYLKDISERRDKIDSEGVLANKGSLARSEALLNVIDEQLTDALVA